MSLSLNKLSAIGASLVVIAVVVAGLQLSGSPARERDRRLDGQRVASLQQLASVVSLYHEVSGSLPPTLAALVDGRNLQELPRDPVTGRSYDYEPEADGSYALCAVFDAASEEGELPEFWMHEAGRYCFRLSPAYGEF
jgi:hypothetical protein